MYPISLIKICLKNQLCQDATHLQISEKRKLTENDKLSCSFDDDTLPLHFPLKTVDSKQSAQILNRVVTWDFKSFIGWSTVRRLVNSKPFLQLITFKDKKTASGLE